MPAGTTSGGSGSTAGHRALLAGNSPLAHFETKLVRKGLKPRRRACHAVVVRAAVAFSWWIVQGCALDERDLAHAEQDTSSPLGMGGGGEESAANSLEPGGVESPANGLELGATCSAAASCASGFCVDSVCCSTGCGDVCASCNIPGSEGACSPIPRDALCPDLSCPEASECRAVDSTQSSSNCEGLGVCRGAARCGIANVEVGTSCQSGIGTCDGNGACVVPGKLILGSACTADDQCAEGHCASTNTGGRCCDVPCNGECQQCGPAGHCEATSGGTCTLIGDGSGECTSGTCTPPLSAPGAQCSAGSQCQSGVCTGGFCCAGACSEVCATCEPGTGACVAPPDDARCPDVTCSSVCKLTEILTTGMCRGVNQCKTVADCPTLRNVEDRTSCGPAGSDQRCSDGRCGPPTVLCGGVNQQVSSTNTCCEILGDAMGLREVFTSPASCPPGSLDVGGLTTTPITCDDATDCALGEMCCLRSVGESAIECTPVADCLGPQQDTEYVVCSSPQGVVTSCQEGTCSPFFLGGFVNGWGFCQ